MRTLTIQEAQERFEDMIATVEEGQSIVITRQGRRIAQLTPAPVASLPRRLPDLALFRQSISHGGQGLSATVIAARRQERY